MINPFMHTLPPDLQAMIRNQNLMALASGLLSAAGPSLRPTGFAQGMGRGLAAMNQQQGQGIALASMLDQRRREQEREQKRSQAAKALAPAGYEGAFEVFPEAAMGAHLGSLYREPKGPTIVPKNAKGYFDADGNFKAFEGISAIPDANSAYAQLLEDRRNYAAYYGEDSDEVKGIDQQIKFLTNPETKITPSSIQSARSAFERVSKQFISTKTAYEKIRYAGENPSPANDISIVFAYMKMLDPTSRVTEGEVATAENVGTIPQTIWGMYNKLLTGEGSMNPTVRAQFLSSAKGIFQVELKNQLGYERSYGDVARLSGMPVDQVIVDYITDEYRPTSSVSAAQSAPPRRTSLSNRSTRPQRKAARIRAFSMEDIKNLPDEFFFSLSPKEQDILEQRMNSLGMPHVR